MGRPGLGGELKQFAHWSWFVLPPSQAYRLHGSPFWPPEWIYSSCSRTTWCSPSDGKASPIIRDIQRFISHPDGTVFIGSAAWEVSFIQDGESNTWFPERIFWEEITPVKSPPADTPFPSRTLSFIIDPRVERFRGSRPGPQPQAARRAPRSPGERGRRWRRRWWGPGSWRWAKEPVFPRARPIRRRGVSERGV